MTTAKNKFFFHGTVSASKSLMNRSLLLKSFHPTLKIQGQSICEDVVKMETAVAELKSGNTLDCGDAGTVLRFMALRAAREQRSFRLEGSARLFERPQTELVNLLTQLGVVAKLESNALTIESRGWQRPMKSINVERTRSSQFASALLLNSWDLPWDLDFQLEPRESDDSYWLMSLRFAKQTGLIFEEKSPGRFHVPARQKPAMSVLAVEPDASSCFVIAVAAALLGEAHVEEFPMASLQPDAEFVNLLRKMMVPITQDRNGLVVQKANRLSAITARMQETPDLFPVLAVLCAFADGQSRLEGAPRLVHKESNRLEKTAELLGLMKVNCKIVRDGLTIDGKGMQIPPQTFTFDPDQDHRMAMAAGVLQRSGWEVGILNPECVRKSFPEFWRILGVPA